ncbi:pentatricopeptide repeat-containing protein [Salix suchowensis]|nr:pentatricopeptide repeat-containing protein [Salix suchowensis]
MGSKLGVVEPMIYALAQHYHGEEAIQTFDVILNACWSCEGRAPEHNACLIDLLGEVRPSDK